MRVFQKKDAVYIITSFSLQTAAHFLTDFLLHIKHLYCEMHEEGSEEQNRTELVS